MNLVPRFLLGDLDLTEYPFSVVWDETEHGSPENVTAVLESLLSDGEILSTTRTNNREMRLTVMAEGTDLLGLAEAEAILVREVSKDANTLTIDPGDGIGVPTVFDTFRGAVDYERREAHEGATIRRFVLTIPALPYGRSESLTTEVAEGIPSVGTTVNSCESTANWSSPVANYKSGGTAPSSMLSVDTSKKVEGSASLLVQPYSDDVAMITSAGTYRLYAARPKLTQSIAVASGGYASFAVRLDTAVSPRPETTSSVREVRITTLERGTETFAADGNDSLASGPKSLSRFVVTMLSDGWQRWSWREASPVTITAIEILTHQYELVTSAAPAYPKTRIDQVAVAASATLGQQVLKAIDVRGSARTAGAVHVAAPSDAIGLKQVAVFTIARDKVPDGWRPDLRQWATAGATTNDPVAPHGSYLSGISDVTFETDGSPVLVAPARLFRGAHTLAACIRNETVSLSLTIEASLMVGATVIASEEFPVVLDAAPSSTGYRMQVLGTMYLPPADIQSPSPDAVVRFRFKGAGPPKLDELYAFPVGGDLSILDAEDFSHLWLDAPSPSQPQGGYWRGKTPTRADATSAWSTTIVPGVHMFDAGTMLAFAGSTSTQGPTVSFDYYPRWLAHAAE